MSAALKIFIIYARKDWRYKNVLLKALKMLQNKGLIEPWHDNDIKVGEDWDAEIRAHLRSADIILPIISFDFFHSNYINDVEIVEAFERYTRGEAVIIPIIADACPWWDSQYLKGFEVLPDDARPIDDWPTKARAMTSIYEGVKRLVLVKNSQANDLIRSLKDNNKQHSNYKINLEKDRKKDRLEPINIAHEERKKRDAFRLFRRGEDSTDWKEKIDLYSQAINLNESYDEAFCNRGLAKIQLKEYESALQDFDETIKINPNYFEAYFNRGWIKLISKRVQEAILDFDHAIRIHPRSANYFYQRGCAKLELNQFVESKNDFNQAIYLIAKAEWF